MNGNYRTGDVVLGEWKLSKLLGQGSYGKVFEAEREDFGIVVKAAIKIITIPASQSEVQSARTEGLDDAGITAYFHSMVEEMVQEFAIMAKLKGNSNIVSYEDHRVMQHTEGIGWDILIRMELLQPMLDYMGSRLMEPREVAKVGVDMCRALELCERNNIIHRDIKPENMFVSELGDFKLGDFGIARTIERSNSNMSKKGTYTYMAPEIYKEEPYNASVDIYSLGIVLYRLLNNNRAPFLPLTGQLSHSDRERALLNRISGAPLPPPANPAGDLGTIVLKACAYRPEDRWQSPGEMRRALETVLALDAFDSQPEEEDEDLTVRSPAPAFPKPKAPAVDEDDEGTVSAVSYRVPVSPAEDDEGTVSAASDGFYSFSTPSRPIPIPNREPPKQQPMAQPPKQQPIAQPPRQQPIAQPPKQEPAAQPPKQQPVAQPPKQEPAAQPPKPEPAAQPIRQEPAAQPPKPEPAAQPIRQEPAAQPPKPEPAAQPIRQEPEKKPSKAEPAAAGDKVLVKKGLIIGIAAAALVIVIGLVILLSSGVLNKPAPTPEPTPSPTPVVTVTPAPTPTVDPNQYKDDDWSDAPIYSGG